MAAVLDNCMPLISTWLSRDIEDVLLPFQNNANAFAMINKRARAIVATKSFACTGAASLSSGCFDPEESSFVIVVLP